LSIIPTRPSLDTMLVPLSMGVGADGLHELCRGVGAGVGEHDTCGAFPSCVGVTVGGVVRASRDGLHDIWFGVGAGVGEQDTCGDTVGSSDKDGRKDTDGTADGCCELLGMLLGLRLFDNDGCEDTDGTADGTSDRDALGILDALGSELKEGCCELLGMLLGSKLFDKDGCEDTDGTADGTMDRDALGCALADGCCELLGIVLGSELFLVVGPAVSVGSCDSDGCDDKDGTPEGAFDCDALGWMEALGFELAEGCCELLGT